MCVHRLYIYAVCGHSVLSQKAEVECLNASIPPDGSSSTTCDLVHHPYQSYRIASLCLNCQQTRKRLLKRIEASQAISFDEAKWKVSYGMPTSGLDFWGKKAQERQRLENESLRTAKKAKSVRFSWRRRRRSENESVFADAASSTRTRN
ncbi:uncharacterized protein LTR77_001438 [Saxophila tyrrhenica]|uniref:Uncharacterized protein n=1 Tax=Saxophila tyrrhenica TaxID=1690608 RepID=A0AAV9PKG7_9PEZI|nr:hypothetical protein LTR77_001438 [Saxophila tyrrhenica]